MTEAQSPPAAGPRPDRAPRWRIEIMAGPNEGAVVPLGVGRHHLGQDAGNDIVLADATIAGRQATIEIDRRAARLQANAPGTQLGGRTLREGARPRMRHGSDIVLGRTRLRLHGPRGRLSLLPLPLATALAAAAVLAVLPQPPAVPRAHAATQDLPRPAAVLPPAPVRAAEAVPAPSPTRLSQAADALRSRLAAQHLGEAISIQAADGAVLATGAVLPAERERWLAEQMWFDATLGGTLALVDRVSVARAEELPRLDVRAVSAGAVPFVVTGSGDRYAEGSVLAGGWTIAHIGAERITLRLGSRSLDIAL